VIDLDIFNKDNQIKIVQEHLKHTTKFSDEKINKLIQNLVSAGELEEEAYDALEELKELKETEERTRLLTIQEQQKKAQDDVKEFRDKIINVVQNSDFITKERKGKLQAFLFNPIRKSDGDYTDYRRNLANLQNNPEHLIQLADILFDYDQKKGINLERFQKQGESKLSTIKASSDFKINKNSQFINWAEFL
jgi:polyhydroxyalkanoate synthesis regulator phasin